MEPIVSQIFRFSLRVGIMGEIRAFMLRGSLPTARRLQLISRSLVRATACDNFLVKTKVLIPSHLP